jgi:hypothetical protein
MPTEPVAIRVSEVGEFIRFQSCERRFKLGLDNRRLARTVPFSERLFKHPNAAHWCTPSSSGSERSVRYPGTRGASLPRGLGCGPHTPKQPSLPNLSARVPSGRNSRAQRFCRAWGPNIAPGYVASADRAGSRAGAKSIRGRKSPFGAPETQGLAFLADRADAAETDIRAHERAAARRSLAGC